MKKTYILLVAFVLTFVLTLATTGIAQSYPPADNDYMDPTTATIELEIIGMGNETLSVTGPTVVERGTPYDNGGDVWVIDTEIISMNLTGTSFLVGPITIVESPTKSSSGYIRQQDNGVDFPADSFFDVFVEIQTGLPSPLSTLYNDDPIPMETTIHTIPPWGSLYISPPEYIPLKDENDNIVGFIKHVSHKIEGPVGGTVTPVNKLALLAPWIILVALITIATVSVAVYRRRR